MENTRNWDCVIIAKPNGELRNEFQRFLFIFKNFFLFICLATNTYYN